MTESAAAGPTLVARLVVLDRRDRPDAAAMTYDVPL
jgi:hypothetical protein